MKPPKKDNMTYLMERFAHIIENIESKKLIIEELMAADFGKYKEMVAYAIGDIYKHFGDIYKLLISITDLQEKSAKQYLELQNMLLRHRHDGEIIIWPEMLFDPTKDS